MLTVENLHLSFPGRRLLNGVSFQLRGRAVACPSGANGSGKSTLLKAIYGLLPVSNADVEIVMRPNPDGWPSILDSRLSTCATASPASRRRTPCSRSSPSKTTCALPASVRFSSDASGIFSALPIMGFGLLFLPSTARMAGLACVRGTL